MTIRLADLTIEADPNAWLTSDPGPGATDALTTNAYDVDLLAVVRHIMRERGDCTIVPIVRAAWVNKTPNKWGHNLRVEVTYAEKGYRAIYGAYRDGTGVSLVQCYMD